MKHEGKTRMPAKNLENRTTVARQPKSGKDKNPTIRLAQQKTMSARMLASKTHGRDASAGTAGADG
ncbi:hypothetical protein [Paraburkholderia terrae]